jgi:hypothetical protein
MAQAIPRSEVAAYLKGLPVLPGETPTPGQPRALIQREDGTELLFGFNANAESLLDLVLQGRDQLHDRLATVLRLSPATPSAVYGPDDIPAAAVRQAAMAAIEGGEKLIVMPQTKAIGHHDLDLPDDPIPPLPDGPTWEYQTVDA